jgi:hypothetical protein
MQRKFERLIDFSEISHMSAKVHIMADSPEEADTKAKQMNVYEYIDSETYDISDFTAEMHYSDSMYKELKNFFIENFNSNQPVVPMIVCEKFRTIFEKYINLIESWEPAELNENDNDSELPW